MKGWKISPQQNITFVVHCLCGLVKLKKYLKIKRKYFKLRINEKLQIPYI